MTYGFINWVPKDGTGEWWIAKDSRNGATIGHVQRDWQSQGWVARGTNFSSIATSLRECGLDILAHFFKGNPTSMPGWARKKAKPIKGLSRER